jgi:hypothetical protein
MSEINRNGLALLAGAIQSNNSGVCCGLDPDISHFPSEITRKKRSIERKTRYFQTRYFLETVINITAPVVCAYKIQKAFFDALMGGHALLRDITSYIHARYPPFPSCWIARSETSTTRWGCICEQRLNCWMLKV